jgi:hypothetical protein
MYFNISGFEICLYLKLNIINMVKNKIYNIRIIFYIFYVFYVFYIFYNIL